LNDEEDSREPIDADFDDLAEAVLVPPQWVINNFLPAGITFLAAPPKTGKSTFTVAAACMVAEYACHALSGEFRSIPQTGPVFIFSAEAMAGEIRYIAEVGLGVKLLPNEGILVAKRPEEFMVDNTAGLARMMHWLENRRPRLVILDPLRNFHEQDENDSGQMIRMLAPLRRWAIENRASFVVVHHTNKPKEGQQHFTAQDMRGSSAMFGIADGVLVCTPGKAANQVRIEATFKRARGWEKTIQVAAYEDRHLQAGELLDATDKKVLAALGHQTGRTIDELAAALGLQSPRVRDILLKLARNKLTHSNEKGWLLNESDSDNSNVVDMRVRS